MIIRGLWKDEKGTFLNYSHGPHRGEERTFAVHFQSRPFTADYIRELWTDCTGSGPTFARSAHLGAGLSFLTYRSASRRMLFTWSVSQCASRPADRPLPHPWHFAQYTIAWRYRRYAGALYDVNV